MQRTVQRAREICGFEFGIYVGSLSNGRTDAIAMQQTMATPESAVLLAVDPESRSMDVVTGVVVRRTLDDRECELALLSLKSHLQAGDLVGGIRDAVTQLAEHARAPRTLHLDDKT